MSDFETHMKTYQDKYWVVRNEDNIVNLVNHFMYLFLKKGKKQPEGKELITISPYNSECSLFLLTMTNSTEQKFNSRVKKVKQDDKFIQKIIPSDDGGMIVFPEETLLSVCEAFKIKKKQKREMSDEDKLILSERLAKIRASKG